MSSPLSNPLRRRSLRQRIAHHTSTTDTPFPSQQESLPSPSTSSPSLNPHLTLHEDVHQQSIWWRNVPLLYNRFVCTPLPQPSNICIPLPSQPIHHESFSKRSSFMDHRRHTAVPPINPLYYKGVFDRAQRLSSGTLTTHPSPPIDFLINSDSEVFIIRLELPLDPQRSASLPRSPKTSDQLASVAVHPAVGRPSEAQHGVKVSDFVTQQRGSLPSALGGAELKDIPTVVTGHLVRRTIGVPILNTVAADVWVTPPQEVQADPIRYCNPVPRKKSSDYPVWRCLVAVKTDDGPIYVFDPIEVMINPPPMKKLPRKSRRPSQTDFYDKGGKHYIPYKMDGAEMAVNENAGDNVLEDSDEKGDLFRRRSSLSDVDLLQAAVAGQPLEFALFDEKESGPKMKSIDGIGSPSSTPKGVEEHHSKREGESHKGGIKGSSSSRTLNRRWFKQNRFTLVLNGLRGSGGTVIWGKTGGNNECICNYVIACNEEGQIGIWDISCDYILNGKYIDEDDDYDMSGSGGGYERDGMMDDVTVKTPLYFISNAHSGGPINSLTWAGSLHPYYNDDRHPLHHLRARHLLVLPEEEERVQRFGAHYKEQTIRGYLAHISFMSVGHDGAAMLWYTEDQDEDDWSGSGKERVMKTVDKDCTMGHLSCEVSDDQRRSCDGRSSGIDGHDGMSVEPIIVKTRQRERIGITEGCGRVGCRHHDKRGLGMEGIGSVGSSDSIPVELLTMSVVKSGKSDEEELTENEEDQEMILAMMVNGQKRDTSRVAKGEVIAYPKATKPQHRQEPYSKATEALHRDHQQNRERISNYNGDNRPVSILCSAREDESETDDSVQLKHKKFFLESTPLTAVTACPLSEEFFLTGDWHGTINRWSMSTLQQPESVKSPEQTPKAAKRRTSRTESSSSSKRSIISTPLTIDDEEEVFIQSPAESYYWHDGPILKLKCIPTLPMLFFSVGLDRSIAFWDMTKQCDRDTSGPHRSRYHTDDQDEHLIGIHGGHRLISVFHHPHSTTSIDDTHDSHHGLKKSSSGLNEHDRDVDPCTGGVINDANWLAFDLPDPLGDHLSSSSSSTTEMKTTTFGLTPGGSSFGSAILSGISVDDNNLLQIWALSDDHFVTPEDNLPKRVRKEGEKEGKKK